MTNQNLKKKIRESLEKSDFKKDILKLSLFGSYAYGTPKEDSDIDLLVELNPKSKVGIFEFSDMQYHFSNNLGREVDLVSKNALSKYFKKEILTNAQKIYER
jgi:hypothetical protein